MDMTKKESWLELMGVQDAFDSRIETRNIEDTFTAWTVEVFEWYNTLETFKNWKQNKGKAKDMQLDEMADMLAFALSFVSQVIALSADNLARDVGQNKAAMAVYKQLFSGGLDKDGLREGFIAEGTETTARTLASLTESGGLNNISRDDIADGPVVLAIVMDTMGNHIDKDSGTFKASVSSAIDVLITTWMFASVMYTEDEVTDAYMRKMQVNHQRQDEGY